VSSQTKVRRESSVQDNQANPTLGRPARDCSFARNTGRNLAES